jgi:hypothetical protein
VSVYNSLGVLASISFLRCAFSRAAFNSAFCQVWADPPLLYKQYFHANSTPQFLGFLGILALGFYILCLGYFVLFRLGKQGRSAIEQ